jgi:hypothetical protein
MQCNQKLNFVRISGLVSAVNHTEERKDKRIFYNLNLPRKKSTSTTLQKFERTTDRMWKKGRKRMTNRKNIRKKKGKAVRYAPYRDSLGDRRYSSYSFLTSALEGGEWSASRPGRALPPGKLTPVPTVQEAGWAPQPVWKQRLEEKSSASVGDRTPAVQAVVRHYTDWATPAHIRKKVRRNWTWKGTSFYISELCLTICLYSSLLPRHCFLRDSVLKHVNSFCRF